MSVFNLLYMNGVTRGGWSTYTAHVVHGLTLAGHEPRLWRIVGKQPGITHRSFGRGVMYGQLTRAMVNKMLSDGENVHILAADPKRVEEVCEYICGGATITIHDPNELKNGMHGILRNAKGITIIRKAMAEHLPGKSVRYVPHPYLRMPDDQRGQEKVLNAVAFSRIDFDKGTHHISVANRAIPQDRWCWLYGFEHRPYAMWKLNKIDPNWREYHGGNWGYDDLWMGVKLAEMSHRVVDMSHIKGDGGGTQYTHLEGLDGCPALVLSADWLTGKLDYDKELSKVAEFVDPSQLATELLGDPSPTDQESIENFFANHDAAMRAVEVVDY